MAGGHGINFVGMAVGESHQNIASAALVAVVLIVVALLGRASLRRAKDPLIPDKGLSLRNFSELAASFILSLGDNAMGKENRKYLPFVGTLFIYLAAMNLLGLVPGFAMPTGVYYVNFGVALTVFIVYHAFGFKAVGHANYLKHFWGPIWWIGWLVLSIEVVSHSIRPVALSLRLYGNMVGDHLLLAVMTDLLKVVFPVIFYCLGTFVCLMQAFVFTLLTMIYIRLAVAHGDDH